MKFKHQFVTRPYGKGIAIGRCEQNNDAMRERLQAGVSYQEIAEEIGVSRDVVSKYAERAGMRVAASNGATSFGVVVAQAKRKSVVAGVAEAIDAGQDPDELIHKAGLDNYLAAWFAGEPTADDAAKKQGLRAHAREKTAQRLKKWGFATSGVTAFVQVADWHYGEVTAHVTGYESWNVTRADTTLDYYAERAAAQIAAWRGMGYAIARVVVVNTGDIIDGHGVFIGQDEHLDLTANQQVGFAARGLAKFIAKLHHECRLPVAHAHCKGNHDVVKFARGKVHELDKSIAELVEINLLGLNVDCPRVRGRNELTVFKCGVSGATVALTHYSTKTATPMWREKLLGWHSAYEVSAVCTGHWHRPQYYEAFGVPGGSGVVWLSSGSPVPGNAFGETHGFRNRPAQTMFIADGQRGVITHAQVDVMPPQYAEQTKRGILDIPVL